jgi:hypothetical protein
VSVEFVSGVSLGEGPVDRFAVTIARVRPCQYGSLYELTRRDASIKTLRGKRRALDFRHIEP